MKELARPRQGANHRTLVQQPRRRSHLLPRQAVVLLVCKCIGNVVIECRSVVTVIKSALGVKLKGEVGTVKSVSEAHRHGTAYTIHGLDVTISLYDKSAVRRPSPPNEVLPGPILIEYEVFVYGGEPDQLADGEVGLRVNGRWRRRWAQGGCWFNRSSWFNRSGRFTRWGGGRLTCRGSSGFTRWSGNRRGGGEDGRRTCYRHRRAPRAARE